MMGKSSSRSRSPARERPLSVAAGARLGRWLDHDLVRFGLQAVLVIAVVVTTVEMLGLLGTPAR
jgi:hypothetical protein